MQRLYATDSCWLQNFAAAKIADFLPAGALSQQRVRVVTKLSSAESVTANDNHVVSCSLGS